MDKNIANIEMEPWVLLKGAFRAALGYLGRFVESDMDNHIKMQWKEGL